MPDQRTIHTNAVDALLDRLTTATGRNLVLEASLAEMIARPCAHSDMVAALHLLHAPLDDLCLECNLAAPCRTVTLLAPFIHSENSG